MTLKAQTVLKLTVIHALFKSEYKTFHNCKEAILTSDSEGH